MEYSIGEFAKLSDLSIHTLRYYEKEGLIVVARDAGGRRRYGEGDIVWIDFIKKLKETGMALRDIRRYAQLRYAGDKTMPERLALLMEHRSSVRREVEKLETNLLNLDDKIKIYEERIAQKIK